MEGLQYGERLKMRSWLEIAIDSGEYPGVEWTDKHRGKFRVPWKHASRHGWNIEKDASIFKMWAVYTGKYPDDCKNMSNQDMKKLAKVWKANFRCALNALQDIEVLREEGKSRGTDAFKVFRILPRQRKGKTTKMRLNSQGSEEIRKCIKARKEIGGMTTRGCIQNDEKNLSTKIHYYNQQDHTYSDSFSNFNINAEEKNDATKEIKMEALSPNFDNMQDATFFNVEQMHYLENREKLGSSDEMESSSSGSDIDCEYSLPIQFYNTSTYDLSSLNALQSTITDVQPQNVQGFTELRNLNTNLFFMGPQQTTNHFKDGAADPFCGPTTLDDMNPTLQFQI